MSDKEKNPFESSPSKGRGKGKKGKDGKKGPSKKQVEEFKKLIRDYKKNQQMRKQGKMPKQGGKMQKKTVSTAGLLASFLSGMHQGVVDPEKLPSKQPEQQQKQQPEEGEDSDEDSSDESSAETEYSGYEFDFSKKSCCEKKKCQRYICCYQPGMAPVPPQGAVMAVDPNQQNMGMMPPPHPQGNAHGCQGAQMQHQMPKCAYQTHNPFEENNMASHPGYHPSHLQGYQQAQCAYQMPQRCSRHENPSNPFASNFHQANACKCQVQSLRGNMFQNHFGGHTGHMGCCHNKNGFDGADSEFSFNKKRKGKKSKKKKKKRKRKESTDSDDSSESESDSDESDFGSAFHKCIQSNFGGCQSHQQKHQRKQCCSQHQQCYGYQQMPQSMMQGGQPMMIPQAQTMPMGQYSPQQAPLQPPIAPNGFNGEHIQQRGPIMQGQGIPPNAVNYSQGVPVAQPNPGMMPGRSPTRVYPGQVVNQYPTQIISRNRIVQRHSRSPVRETPIDTRSPGRRNLIGSRSPSRQMGQNTRSPYIPRQSYGKSPRDQGYSKYSPRKSYQRSPRSSYQDNRTPVMSTFDHLNRKLTTTYAGSRSRSRDRSASPEEIHYQIPRTMPQRPRTNAYLPSTKSPNYAARTPSYLSKGDSKRIGFGLTEKDLYRQSKRSSLYRSGYSRSRSRSGSTSPVRYY